MKNGTEEVKDRGPAVGADGSEHEAPPKRRRRSRPKRRDASPPPAIPALESAQAIREALATRRRQAHARALAVLLAAHSAYQAARQMLDAVALDRETEADDAEQGVRSFTANVLASLGEVA